MSINGTLYNGLSGMNSFSTALSVVSDNVANANTTGFKSNSVRFGDLVNTYLALQTNDNESEGAGSNILGIATNFAQGLLLGTSNWSDMAVSGEGFFVVKDVMSDGTTGALPYYTRDGSFHLDPNGFLINQQGYRVQGYPDGGGDYSDIQVQNPENYVSVHVETDGTIIAVDKEGLERTLAKVALATFTNKNGLARQGGNLSIAGPEIGNVFTNGENPELFGKVYDYSIESSNVDLGKEMVDMIIYQASYNANSKTITTGRELLDTTINMIR